MSLCWTWPRPMASRSTAPLFGGRGTLSGRRMEQDLQALEQKRKDVADLRHIRITKRRPFMADHLERLAFIEETSVKTNMARTTGWAPCGQRLVDHAPFGRRRTQTFIGTLRPTGRAMGDRRRDGRVLHQNPTGSDPASRRCGHSGQPLRSQKSRQRTGLARHRNPVPVAAALQP